MSTSQLPSKRDIVRHFYVLNDLDAATRKKNEKPKTFEACKKLANIVHGIWQMANPNISTITLKVIETKIYRLVQAALDINSKKATPSKKKGRGKPVLRPGDEASLESLFDISKCKCPLQEATCSHPSVMCRTPSCVQQHYSCTCREKIPAEDRFYLKDQRERLGSAGRFQMGAVDPAYRGGASATGAASSSATGAASSPATASSSQFVELSTDTESGKQQTLQDF